MFSRYFIERPVLANTLALVIILMGALSLLRLPVSQYPDVVPPTVLGNRELSRCQRTHGDGHRGTAHRAAGQRRRRHDLYAIDQCQRRQLQSRRHLRRRYQPRHGPGSGAESRLAGHSPAAGGGRGPGTSTSKRSRPQSSSSSACIHRTDGTTTCFLPTMPRSTLKTSWPGCLGLDPSRCSEPAPMPCGSGSIRTACRPLG